MLRKLQEAFQTKALPFFWHPKHNLLGKMEAIVMDNYANRLNKILADIDKNILTNRFVIADAICEYQLPIIITERTIQ